MAILKRNLKSTTAQATTRVRMLVTQYGDGVTLVRGQEYNVLDTLAREMIADGRAEMLSAEKQDAEGGTYEDEVSNG